MLAISFGLSAKLSRNLSFIASSDKSPRAAPTCSMTLADSAAPHWSDSGKDSPTNCAAKAPVVNASPAPVFSTILLGNGT